MEALRSPSASSKSKCFSFWPNRRRKAAARVRISWPDVEPESDERAAEVRTVAEPKTETCFAKASIDTFARCCTPAKPYPQRMTMRPFFGIYAGSLLTFDIKKRSRPNDALTSIRVSIQETSSEGRKGLSTIYVSKKSDGSSSLNASLLKDRCLGFAYDLNTSSDVADIATACKQPPSLFFLCQREVLLHLGELNPELLPKTGPFAALKLQKTRNIFIRVYRSNQPEDVMMRMRVKSALSINELKWMICGRLPFSVHPSSLALYESNSLQVLPPGEGVTLQPEQTLLHCLVDQSAPLTRLPSRQQHNPCRYFISMIGRDIDIVVADPSTSLFRFQELVKSKFRLKANSYVYFGKTGRSEDSGIKMSTIVDKSTICLIDSMRRNLPIVDGIPLAISKYENLSAYSRPISSLGISPGSPVIAFEVTGPTIPISFRAAIQDRGNCNYSVVSDRVHAVSVNPDWTLNTLLKYIECISKIPSVGISLKSESLPLECNVSSHLTSRCWLQRKSSRLELVKDLPTIIHS